MHRNKYALAIAFLCAEGCAFSLHEGWPGAVSIDMFQTIEEAIHSRYRGHYDPMATMLWRMPLALMSTPAAVASIFTLQTLALWLSIALMALRSIELGSRSVAFLVIAAAFSPPFLCYSVAIESNVQVATWWSASILACLTWRRPRTLLMVTPLLWVGFTARYGTVIALIPVCWLCMRVTINKWSHFRIGLAAIAIAASMQTLSTVVTRSILKAPPSFSTMSVSQLFDMTGVYNMSGKHCIPDTHIPPGATIEDVAVHYDVRSCGPLFWRTDGRPTFSLAKTEEDANSLHAAWWNTIHQQPLAYLAIKARFALAFLLWSFDHAYGLPPDFSGNHYIGVNAPTNPSAHPLPRYANASKFCWLWRGWIWILLCFFAIASARLLRLKETAPALAAFLAGLFLMVPHFAFGQAAVGRYYLPPFMMFLICLSSLIPRIWKSAKAELARSTYRR